MSAGSAFIRVLLVVMNLSIVGILAVSVYGVAGTSPQLDFDPDAVVTEFNEDEISIYAPFSIQFGGYWDIEDFYYSYYILDDNGTTIADGGQGPMVLQKDVANHITIAESINTSQLLSMVDEDIILNGINLSMGVEMGASYMSSLLSFSFSLDLAIPVEPLLEEFEIDEDSIMYNGTALQFTVNHTASSMLQNISLPLGVQMMNDTTTLGESMTEMNFGEPNTTFTIEINQTVLEDAIVSGDMIFLRFGLMMNNSTSGPSFTVDFFQLKGYGISSASYDVVATQIQANLTMYLDTFSAIGMSTTVNASMVNVSHVEDSINDLTINLNGNETGTLTFQIDAADWENFAYGFTLQMRVYMFGDDPIIVETEFQEVA